MAYIETEKLQISVTASKIGSQNTEWALVIFLLLLLSLLLFLSIYLPIFFFRDAKLVNPQFYVLKDAKLDKIPLFVWAFRSHGVTKFVVYW